MPFFIPPYPSLSGKYRNALRHTARVRQVFHEASEGGKSFLLLRCASGGDELVTACCEMEERKRSDITQSQTWGDTS
eukprot:749450-Hanusia_phi.AAC.5